MEDYTYYRILSFLRKINYIVYLWEKLKFEKENDGNIGIFQQRIVSN